MRPRSLLTLLPVLPALAFVLLGAAPALAAWPSNIAVNLPLGNPAIAKYDVATCPDGQGGIIVSWVEFGGGYDVIAQRVSASGQVLWGANGTPVVAVAANQQLPSMEPDGSGGALFLWMDDRNGNYDLYAQHLNAAGAPTWGPGGVAVCTDPSTQTGGGLTFGFPIVSDGAGGFITTWTDSRNGNTDVFAQHVSSTGTATWTGNGVTVCNDASVQLTPVLASDGAGGAYIVWADNRPGNYDIYGQHLNAAGAPQWTANGLGCITVALNQTSPAVVSDDAGGCVLTWLDARAGNTAVYAERLNNAGVAYWTSSGVIVCNAAGSRSYLDAVPDGSGGAFVEWLDNRGTPDLYLQHMSGTGSAMWAPDGVQVHALSTAAATKGPALVPDGAGGVLTAWSGQFGGGVTVDVIAQHFASGGYNLWASGGVPICNAPSQQYSVGAVSDGNGGMIAGWWDIRSGTPQTYAQRVDRYGNVGSTEPSIINVRDVLGDQGGQVKLKWNASTLDVDGLFGIYDYRIWRSAPSRLVASSLLESRSLTSDPNLAATHGELLVIGGYAWEYLESQPAATLPTYSVVAATTADSIGAGNPRTAFMVEADAGSYLGAPYWFSAPDSGYSVDNLPPVIPAPFTGQYSVGTSHLHWNPNPDADLAGYRLYRGSTPGFTPDGAHLVSAVPDTGYLDVAGAPFYYKLSAVDVHGNESGFATLLPAGTANVSDALPRALALAPPSPNPARAGAGLTLRFSLPAAGRVTLARLDAQGRQVREIAAGERVAGSYSLPFDGQSDAGARLKPGLYFVRMVAGDQHLTQRLALID